MTPEQRSLRARIAAHSRWANANDRLAATAPARRGLEARFERLADPTGELPPAERARRAENLRRAHYLRMAAASAKARRKRKSA